MDSFLKGLSAIKKAIIYIYNDVKSGISKAWNDLSYIFKNRNITINRGNFSFSIS